MKKLVLNLTDAQFRRFAIVGALLQAKVEHVVVGLALNELDSYHGSDWQESEEMLHHAVESYGEMRKAFMSFNRSRRVESTAPARRLALARKEAARA